MVHFEEIGTEAEALSEQDDFGYEGGRRRRGRGPTKYTSCRYCGKPFPLREISAHARNEHREESTRYTDCWKCGGRYPLYEIRAHARSCNGVKAEPAPKPATQYLIKPYEMLKWAELNLPSDKSAPEESFTLEQLAEWLRVVNADGSR